MTKEEIREILAQMVEQLRFYKSLGIRTTELSGEPVNPAKLARLLAARAESPAPIKMEAVPAVVFPDTTVLQHASPAPSVEAQTPPSPTPPVPDEAPPQNKRPDMLFDLGASLHEVRPVSIFETLPKDDTLERIRGDLGDCRRCKLCKTRTNIVFGVGSPEAQLMLIGEGPGADEDAQGVPFVGRAGQLLTKILEAIQLTRAEVYITNVVKCRPPQNRKPEPDEIDPCEPFLWRQINAIKPKLICALGGTAAQALLKTKEGITSMRGRVFDFHGYKLMPTFHPAYLLRNPADKRLVWEDMQKVRDYLQGRITL